METPDFEHGIVYFKQFGTERVYDGCTQKSITQVVGKHPFDKFGSFYI